MESALAAHSPPPARLHRSALAMALALFGVMLAVRWYPPITGIDGAHYIVAGRALVEDGRYVNPSGAPELWFPPFFPLLVGATSVFGALDPVVAARAVTIVTSVIALCLFAAIGRFPPRERGLAALALVLLAVNPLFEWQAISVLSESTATVLMLAALWLWLRPQPRPFAFAGVGLLSGLAYLTRPESVIPFALWTLIDCAWRRNRRVWTGYAVAWVIFVLCALPYVLYLRRETGGMSLSNKLGITLAAGRSLYYDCPREWIDPATLELTTYSCPVTLRSEVRRYASNVSALPQRYMNVLFDRRMPMIVALVVFGIGMAGLFSMWRRDRHLTAGLVAMFGAVPVICALDLKARYLHMTLPGLVLFLAAGCIAIGRVIAGREQPGVWRRVAAAIPAVVLLVLPVLFVERGRGPIGPASRDAGLAMRALPPGVVFEPGTSVGYYAAMPRYELPINDFDTLKRFAQARFDRPVYLAMSDALRTHPSLDAVLTSPDYPALVKVDRDGFTITVVRLR